MKRLSTLLLLIATAALAQPAASPAPSETNRAVATEAKAGAPAPLPPPAMFAVRLTKGPAWDEAKSPDAQVGMRDHRANIARMRREGVIVLGAHVGDAWLVVLRVPDEVAARKQFESDPIVAAGVYKLQFDLFTPFAHGTTAYPMTPEAILLRAYLDAFNRHDADAVAACCTEDLKWYTVDNGIVAPETEGRARLHEWLVGYFKKLPSVRSEFLSLEQTGAFISVRERPSWENREGKRVAQQAIGVYEIRDGLIARAWYFPATRDTPPAK